MMNMEITIKSEKYLNADPPVLTEKMLDWLFLTMWSIRPEQYNIKRIDSIDIIANTAYNGCNKIHFYIRINNMYIFHKEFEKDSPLYLQNPPIGNSYEKTEYDLNWLDQPTERWEWMNYFVERGIDMGEEGRECANKISDMIAQRKLIDKKTREAEEKYNRYKLYLELKKEFEKS